jgi:hypothetical protein
MLGPALVQAWLSGVAPLRLAAFTFAPAATSRSVMAASSR